MPPTAKVVIEQGDEQTTAATGSPLASIRARRAALLAALFLDLKVPRWEDSDAGTSIWVHYQPVKSGKITSALERRQAERKKWGDDWITVAQADVLIDACVGVYLQNDAERAAAGTTAGERVGRYSLKENDANGDWTRFDPDLAEALGLTEGDAQPTAIDVVRALYLTDGDLSLAYNSLVNWSGDVSEEAEERNRGN